MTVLAPARDRAGWRHRAADWLRSRRATELGGAMVSLVVGGVLYTRFSLQGLFWRDEAIYVYGGQQLATHGTPPYASVFDPKTPGSTMLAGAAAWVARLLGVDDLYAIRSAFFAFSLLTVLAVYLLVLQLWRSVTGAVVAAVVMASFAGFALDAISGPDAHAPGIPLAVLSMWLIARRQWLWAGMTGSLALLMWQPLAIYPAFAVGAAVLLSPRQRRRALALSLAGVAAPLLVTLMYFASASAFGRFVEASVVFPVAGYRGGHLPLPRQLRHIEWVVLHSYGGTGAVLLYGGLLLLLVLAAAVLVAARDRWRTALAHPLVLVLVPTLLAETAFAVQDFHSYPRVFPFLPYAAVGCGGAVSVGLRKITRSTAHRVAVAMALVPALAFAVVSAYWFSHDPRNNHLLLAERAMACALNRIVVPGTGLYALGDPVPLVLTHRRNPDRFVYLMSGVAQWKIDHTSGGFDGWTNQIAASRSSVIVSRAWDGAVEERMRAWLGTRYAHGWDGGWPLFLTPQAEARAADAGIALTAAPTRWPQTTQMTRYTCSG